MIVETNKAIVLVVENSDTNLGAGTAYQNAEYKATSEPLEEEVIKCIEGLKKCLTEPIDIVVICPSKRLPKKKTVKAIKELGAHYLEPFLPDTEYFTCGYWNVPIAMAWFEKHYDYETIIHIDLDMTMFRMQDNRLFDLDEGLDAKVGILSREEMKDVHIGDYEQHHETNFMVAKCGFYTDWWNKVKELSEQYDPKWERYAELEEFAIDIMWLETHAIEPVEHYQIGLRYPVSDIPDHMLYNVSFVHAHPYEDTTKMWKEYTRRRVEYDSKKNSI
jgi:hypothetical protein